MGVGPLQQGRVSRCVGIRMCTIAFPKSGASNHKEKALFLGPWGCLQSVSRRDPAILCMN